MAAHPPAHAETRFSVVEIDPGVSPWAQYFHFPEEDARLEIGIGDGAQVVPQLPGAADVLVVDGFVDECGRRPCARNPSTTAPRGPASRGRDVANFMSDDGRIEPIAGPSKKASPRSYPAVAKRRTILSPSPSQRPPRIAWAELKARPAPRSGFRPS